MKTVKIITTVAFIFSYCALLAQSPKAKSVQKGPMPSIAGKTAGNITKEEFLADSILRMDDGTLTQKNQWKITSFRITFAGKGINYTEFKSTSDTIPEKVKAFVREAPTGTKFFIEYITAKQMTGSDSRSRAIS